MPINAPYNFVPLSKKVYFPNWADKISHDLPFKDGLSGTIELELTAKTALSIGDADGDFFKLPNGKYAIPGSSIRGMIRNVFEIATLSKMQLVDNQTFSLRDFSGTHISDVYTGALTEERDVGYLQLKKGVHTITPCNYKKVSYADYQELVGIDLKPEKRRRNGKDTIFHKRVRDKYKLWSTAVNGKDVTDLNKKFATFIDNQSSFIPVFSGGFDGKEHDYIFFGEDPSRTFSLVDIDENAWCDFLETHGDDVKGAAANPMAWPSYWKDKYYKGERVPVFYKQSENRLRIGLTYMMKFSGDHRVKELINNTSEDHSSNKMDLTEALFGLALDDEDGGLSLKSRVQFGLAYLISDNQETGTTQTILASPKPSYFPNYLKQTSPRLGNNEQYITYINYNQVKPEIRGRKIYPVTSNNTQQNGAGNNQKVAVTLQTLPKGSQFKATVNFHNLRPIELGALLWSINIDNRIHTIGGGKPIHLGHIKIDINNEEIIPNNIEIEARWNPEKLVNHFIKKMKSFYPKWEESEEIQTLLAAKTPKEKLKGLKFEGELVNMKIGEFSSKKTAGESLQPYLTKTILPKMRAEIKVVTTENIWRNAKVQKVNNQLQITFEKLRAITSTDMMTFNLSKKKLRSLKNGTLFLDIIVESKGNKHIVKEIKPPQP